MSRGVHVAVDAVGAKHGGAAAVLCDVTRAALADPDVERVTVFASPRGLRRFTFPEDARLVVRDVEWAERSRLGRILWHRFGLPTATRREGAQALLCLSSGGRPARRVRSAVLIQQSLPFSTEAIALESLLGRIRLAMLRRSMRESAAASSCVVVQSPTMSRWVQAGLGVPASRVLVVPPTAPPFPESRAPKNVVDVVDRVSPDGRLLYVGSDSAYKNLPILVKGLELARRAQPGLTLFLTLPRDHPLTRNDGVVGLGPLDRSTLRAVYERATLLIMPSLVETVGLPMLEAMELGIPILAADRPYARDACGDGAEFFGPLDLGQLSTQILRLIGDRSLRAKLAERGMARASRLSASRPYERMARVLVRLARGDVPASWGEDEH